MLAQRRDTRRQATARRYAPRRHDPRQRTPRPHRLTLHEVAERARAAAAENAGARDAKAIARQRQRSRLRVLGEACLDEDERTLRGECCGYLIDAFGGLAIAGAELLEQAREDKHDREALIPGGQIGIGTGPQLEIDGTRVAHALVARSDCPLGEIDADEVTIRVPRREPCFEIPGVAAA